MLDFIGNTFKELFSVITIIAIILVVIMGFVFMSDSVLVGFLILVGGLVSIILSAGLVSLFINIRDDLHYIKDNLNYKSSANVTANKKNKKCPFCAEDIKPEARFCPHCNKNIEQYEKEEKEKIEEEKKKREMEKIEKNEKYKSIHDIFNDASIIKEAENLRIFYGKGAYINHLKAKARELGFGEIDLKIDDIE